MTREAGVATGLLYTHFTDFDAFLTGYAVDRAFQLAGAVAGLPSRAGSGGVAGNLGDALLTTPLATLAAFTRLSALRPDLAPGVEAVLGTGGLQAVERTVADYLAAEQHLGRIPAAASPEALALVVVGVLHHVALTAAPGPASDTLIRSAMATLTAGFPAVAPS
ncbi:TetR/AcrR family transcriptional regulator [Dactylosporangium cerinum]